MIFQFWAKLLAIIIKLNIRNKQNINYIFLDQNAQGRCSMILENAPIFVIIACLLVVIVLMIGLGGFAFGGAFNKKYANKIMRLRILLQAIAILLIIIFVYFSRGG